MIEQTFLLHPAPRRIEHLAGSNLLRDGLLILLQGDELGSLRFAAGKVQPALRRHLSTAWELTASRAVPPECVGLTITVAAGAFPHPQGYELLISPGCVSISAQDKAGAFYGACTLAQIIEQAGPQLPCMRIADWPDFPARCVMLDISRDKVPTLQTLKDLVDMLASWKINQLQLYTEHTFAYRNHPDVWVKASPFTGDEILELDEFCRQRHVELVPNQNSFGHMNRWLKLPRYQHLAETVGGYDMPWGHEQGSFSLCPTDPHSLELVSGLYDELLPHFSSRQVNVGCDETFDIGQGRSREAVAAGGAGQVYLDFLLQIYQQVKQRGCTMQFWSDIILRYPAYIPQLPKDVIALEWGYEANHPFDEHCARLAEAGIPFYVCPGTSSWCSLGGRTQNALANLKSAAESGLRHGAQGYLVTDWGDNGHWQPLPVSYLGFAAGAAYAWAYEANRGMDLPAVLNRFAFHDPSGVLGQVAYDLGNAYLDYGLVWENSSIIFGTLQASLERIRLYKGVNPEGYCRVLEAVDRATARLEQAAPQGPGGELLLREFRLVARMMRHACRRGLMALETGPLQAAEQRGALEDDLRGLMVEFGQVWLSRNRPGGLPDSLARFEKILPDYRLV